MNAGIAYTLDILQHISRKTWEMRVCLSSKDLRLGLASGPGAIHVASLLEPQLSCPRSIDSQDC